VSHWSDEETDNPLYADRRKCKVEKWSRDGLRVELVFYGGKKLDKDRAPRVCWSLLTTVRDTWSPSITCRPAGHHPVAAAKNRFHI